MFAVPLFCFTFSISVAAVADRRWRKMFLWWPHTVSGPFLFNIKLARSLAGRLFANTA